MKRIISFLLALSMTVQLSMIAGAEVAVPDTNDNISQSSVQEDEKNVSDSPVDVVLDDSTKSAEENGDETQFLHDDESEKENVQLPAEELLTNVEENPEPQEENVVVLQTEPLFEYTVNKSSQTVTITKYNGNETSVMVPDTLDGYSVTAIGDSAFNKNSTITEVILSDSITEIGNYAFRNCENLVNVDLPKNLVEIGYNVFQNDNKITALTIPATLQTANAYFPIGDTMHTPFLGMGGLKEIVFEAGTTKIPDSLFAGCSELESIALPETITEIGSSAFRECNKLASVELPESVKKIGGTAFGGDVALKEVTLPDSITEIGNYAFRNCENLVNVDLPKNLVEIGYNVFQNDNKITALTIPATLQTANAYFPIGDTMHTPFLGMGGLKEIVFEAGTTKIPDSLFAGCSKLESIVLPNTITKIGNSAFRECSNLSDVAIAAGQAQFGDNIFKNSQNVRLYGSASSNTALYAMENKVPFEIAGEFQDDESYILDRSGTNYFTDTNNVTANGYVTVNINYAIKPMWQGKIDKSNICVLLPDGAELIDSTVKMDDPEASYDENGSVITFTTNKQSGNFKFSVKAASTVGFTSVAYITYRKNKANYREVIGVSNETIPALTMDLPQIFSGNSFKVTGLAPSSTTVNLSVDGTLIKTVTASKAGNWEAELSIENPEEYRSYAVCAEGTVNGEKVDAQQLISYYSMEPEVTGLVFQYSTTSKTKTYDILGNDGVIPAITYYPARKMKFTATVSNAEEIEKFYITSTRNGVKKYLEATYNADTNEFIAEGTFREDDKDYVPGKISYEYTVKRPEVQVTEQVNWNEFQNKVGVTSEQAVTVLKNTATMYQAAVDLSGFSEALANTVVDTMIEVIDDQNGTDLSGWIKKYEKGIEIVKKIDGLVNGKDGKTYETVLAELDDGTLLMVAKEVGGSKITKMVLESKYKDATDGGLQFDQISSALSGANIVLGAAYNKYKIDGEVADIRAEILRNDANLSEAEIDAALKKLDDYATDKMTFGLMMTVLPLAVGTVAGIGISAPAILFSAMLGMISSSSDFFWDMRVNQIKGKSYKMKWIVDPSGYVYDNETQERLEDVTVTAYWIPYDESDAFWNNKPDSDDYGELWNAAEYNQENPMNTDDEGNYAWNVPEGWWRVKYEKADYETVWSDWMPVPPPQTEVNVGMKFTGERPYKLGDVNADGKINVVDAYLIRCHAAQLKILDGTQQLAADVNRDGRINVVDAYLVRCYAAQLINEFPAA